MQKNLQLIDLLAEAEEDVKYFVQELLRESPDKPHKQQLKLIKMHNRLLLVTSGHRGGKSTGIAQKHVYYNLFKVGIKRDDNFPFAEYKTLNCSYEYRAAQLVFDKIVAMTRKSPYLKPGGQIVRRVMEKERKIIFENNAEFHFASLEEHGKHIEGEPYRLITVDEAARVTNLEELYKTVLKPRGMGIGGIVALVGTHRKEADPWLELIWQEAKREKWITPFRMSTYDNPYLSKADIKQMERELKSNPAARDVILHGKFWPGTGKLLTTEQIENATDRTSAAESDETGVRWGTQPYQPGHKYISFWDLAFDTDWTVGITLDVTEMPHRLVNYTRVNKNNVTGWNEIWMLMKQEIGRYQLAANQIYYDATGMAGGIIEEVLDEKEIPADPHKTTTKDAKDELINALVVGFCYNQPIYDKEGSLLDGKPKSWGKVRIPPIKQLIRELESYRRDDKHLVTDSVIALAGCLQNAPEVYDPPTSFHRKLPKHLRAFQRNIANPAFVDEEKEKEKAKKPIKKKTIDILREGKRI